MNDLPSDYAMDNQIYQLAKRLGQSEEQIKEQYSFTEIIERSLFEVHGGYIDREMMKDK